MGWSAGQRSVCQFHWVKNIEDKHHLSPIEKIDSNIKGSSLFAFAYQLMRRKCPQEPINDLDAWVKKSKLPRMNADGVLSSSLPLPPPLPSRPPKIPKPKVSKRKGKKAVKNQTETPAETPQPSIPDDSELGKLPVPTNKYQVPLAEHTFTFHNHDLAPPGGVMSVNYSRYVYIYLKYLFKHLLISLKTRTF